MNNRIKYTGLRDLQGKEVKDGDLVELHFARQSNEYPRDSFGVYQVFYSAENAAFFLRVHKKNWFDLFFRTEDDVKKRTIDERCRPVKITELPLSHYRNIIKIIGNIRKNPELIDSRLQ